MAVTEPRVAPGVRRLAWHMAAGLGGGAAVGYVFAGPASRLLMAALRLSSPDAVRGVTSDDGFTIGRVSAATFILLLICGAIGGAAGVAYALLRLAIPHRPARLALWTALGGLTGGAIIVHTDGVDFRLLEPTALAVGGFVALLAIAALLIGLLVDRWSAAPPARDRRTVMILAGCAAGFQAIPVAAGGLVVALALARAEAVPRLGRAVTIAAGTAVTALTVMGGVDLVRDIAALA